MAWPAAEVGHIGHRIAIVGYSHHRNPKHRDNNQFTLGVMEKVLSGELTGDSLFPRVPAYFGYDDRNAFWKRVWFFNFIPACIGNDDEKYATADTKQNLRAKQRFNRILQEEKIEKVFVFTTKGWSNCPSTDEEESGNSCPLLGPEFLGTTWGTYTIGRRKILAFGFRHPQFARREIMKSAVTEALSRRPA